MWFDTFERWRGNDLRCPQRISFWHSTWCVDILVSALQWTLRGPAKGRHSLCRPGVCMERRRIRLWVMASWCYWSTLTTFGGPPFERWSVLHLFGFTIRPYILVHQLATLGQSSNSWPVRSDSRQWFRSFCWFPEGRILYYSSTSSDLVPCSCIVLVARVWESELAIHAYASSICVLFRMYVANHLARFLVSCLKIRVFPRDAHEALIAGLDRCAVRATESVFRY